MRETHEKIEGEKNEFLRLIHDVEEAVDHYETFGDETDYFDEDEYLILRVHKTENGNIIYDFGPGGAYEFNTEGNIEENDHKIEQEKYEEEYPEVTEDTDPSLYCDSIGENPYDAWMTDNDKDIEENNDYDDLEEA